jgi:hypothetical protein
MRRLPAVSAAVLLCCLAMSANGAGENELSGDRIPTDDGVLVIHPIHHATFLMQWNGKTVYVDPVGDVKPFADLPMPDLVLVTCCRGCLAKWHRIPKGHPLTPEQIDYIVAVLARWLEKEGQ